ncbi:MAG TPA: HmuY family protein [Fontimonas sp.]
MIKKHLAVLPLALAALLLGACAEDISPRDPATGGPDPESPALPGAGGPQAAFSQHADGYYQAQIDASGSDWVYLDLAKQVQVFPATPDSSAEWDIALMGTDIKLNGGVSGAPPQGFAVEVYAEKTAVGTPYPFEEIDAAPTATAVDYVSDEAGLLPVLPPRLAMTRYPAPDESPNAFTGAGDHGWYHSSGATAGAQISARTNVGYVVRGVACRYFKLRMTGYADAQPRFDVLEIPGPACVGAGAGGEAAPLGRATFTDNGNSTTASVDASSEEQWVYLSLLNADQVVPADAANDPSGWDIAWKRSDIKINSGSSGSGSVEIHAGLRDDWDQRSSVPADAQWHRDEGDALAFVTYPPREVGGECAFNADGDYGWYYYSGFCDKGDGNHYISPRDVVYIVRDGAGNSWKLRVLSYYGSAGEAAHPTFEYAPVTP